MTRLLETLNPIEALVHETLNGEYELTFTTTARNVNKFDLLSAHTPNGRQLFRVAGVTNHADKSEIFARHVFFDLSGNFSLGFDSKDVTCQTMINKFVSSLTEPLTPFALSTDITDRNSYNPEEANALEILSHGKRSIVGVNDAELLRDNYAVKLQKRLGSDTNVLIHPRNNILDLKREYSSDDICTKIFLRGGTEEAPLEATITSPLIDKYPVVYARRYQNETDSITTVEQLIAWGKLHFDTDRIDVPKLSFDFDVFGDLGLQLGDSALVRVPELDVDVRSRVTGYDYDPMTQKYVKLYFGDKSTGLAGFIGDTTTGIVDEAVKNVDEKLQAEIDNANAAIQKEYEARVESVNDAIAKAEADAALVKSELQGELSQAVKDWEFDFEDAKTQINTSIGNVSKELGEYIKSTDEIIAEHDDLLADASAAIGNMNTEIGNAKNDISDLFESTEANQGAIVTVSNNLGTLSTKVSNVETTANTANATASEVKQTASGLTSSVSSLQGTVDEVTGDITNMKSDITSVTQTASGLTSKVESLESDNVTNKQNISSVTQTADGLKSDVSSVTTTANTALAKATTVEQTASGLSSKVTSLETSDSTQNSNISQLQQTASGLTSTVSSHTNQLDGKTASALKTLADTANTNAGKAQTSADTANNLLTDIASDSKFTASEKQQVKTEWDIIVSEQASIKTEAAKFSVSTTDYTNKYNTLNTYITPLLSSLTTTSDIVGTTFRTNFKNYYDARQTVLNGISSKAKSLADTAQSTADTAQTTADAAKSTADSAQTSATNANNLHADIASDSKFTASEKQQAKKEWNIVVGEKAGITSEGSRYGISTTDYTNKYNTLNTYITPLLSSLTTTSDIVGTTYRANWKNYYDARQVLLNAISAKAKSLADTAQSTADTAYSEIQQTADKISMVVSDGSTASAVQLTPNALTAIAKDINLKGNVQFGSLVEGDGTSTEILGGKIKTNTIKTSTLVVDKEILVDGTIKAVHLDGGTANIAEITSLVMSTEALNAAWANIGNAIIDKLTSDEALFQRLTAKTAWITSANIVSLDASKTTTGMLKSQNGRVVFDLNNAVLYANASTGNKYIQIDQDGVKLHNPSSTSAAQWGQLYAQNNRFTIRSRGDSRGLSLGYDLNDSYQECAFFSATSGNVQFLKQVQFNTEGHFKGGYNRFGQEGQGYFEIWGNSGAHKINPNAGNTGALGDGTRYFNSSWVANRNNPSSLEFKNVSHYLDDSESLNLVKNVGVARYFYKGDEFVSKNSQTGLIYEDVRDQPQRDLLTNEEDKAINIYNMNSVLWSAVRALNENLNAEIVSLRAENEALRTDVTTLRDEIALERSERETLRAELNALTDLIAGKATVKVRT